MSIRLSEDKVIARDMAKKSNLTIGEARKAYFKEKHELNKVIRKLMETEDFNEGIDLSIEMQMKARQLAVYKEVIELRKQEAKDDKFIKKEAYKVNKIVKKFIKKYEA